MIENHETFFCVFQQQSNSAKIPLNIIFVIVQISNMPRLQAFLSILLTVQCISYLAISGTDTPIVANSIGSSLHYASLVTFTSYQTLSYSPHSQWIWDGPTNYDPNCVMNFLVNHNFTIKCLNQPLTINICADDSFVATLNGQTFSQISFQQRNLTITTTNVSCGQVLTLELNITNVPTGSSIGCFQNNAGFAYGVISPDCPPCNSTSVFDQNICTCGLCNNYITGCTSCSSKTVCNTCDPYHAFDHGTCLACDPNCLTCEGTPTNCTSCDGGNSLSLSNNACVCPVGKYYSDSTHLCASCASTCQTCSGSNSDQCLTCISGLVSSSNRCLCPSHGDYYDGTVCTACHPSCQTCSGGTDAGCLSCGLPAVLSGTLCSCPDGGFADSAGKCQYCDANCKTCVGTPTNCSSCNSPLTSSGTVCQCPDGTYWNSPVCSGCHSTCLTCAGPTDSECISCPAWFVAKGSSCGCSDGSYLNAASNACSVCAPTCLACTDASTCSSCDFALNRQLAANGSCVCDQYSTEDGLLCAPICGDGWIVSNEQCDDGNIADGDGCSSSCKIEANYNCSGQGTNGPSICSYTLPLKFTVIYSEKLLTQNTIHFKIKIQPAIIAIKSLDWASALTINLINASVSSYSFSNGNLILIVKYNSRIQDQNFVLRFKAPPSNPYFQSTPSSEAEFQVDPSNNLAAVYYEDSVYKSVQVAQGFAKALMYLSLVGFAAGLFVAKFIGVEMIGVVQIAFIGLITVNYVQPVLAPLSQIGMVNGVNTMFSGDETDMGFGSVPNRITALQYQPAMAYVLNYTVIILILPFVASLVFCVASYAIKAHKEKLRSWSLVALCEFGLASTMFILYHFTVGLFLSLLYFQSDTALFPVSVVECVLFVAAIVAMIVLFIKRSDQFGDFKRQFKRDVISQHYYLFLMLGRFAVAAILVAANGVSTVAFIAVAVPVTGVIAIAVKRPYVRPYNNYRAIANEATIATVLGIYGYYRVSVTYADTSNIHVSVLPILEITFLYVIVCMNIFFIGKLQYDKCKQRKNIQQEIKKHKLSLALQEENKAKKIFVQQAKKRFQRAARGINTSRQFQPEVVTTPQHIEEPLFSSIKIKRQLQQSLIQNKKKIVLENKDNEEQVRKIQDDFDSI